MSTIIPLELIQIESPCPANWDDMRGDERTRFCTHCNLNVYNISALSREAAENLVASREGRMCIQMFRREDGTVMTNDCGKVRAFAERSARFASRVAVIAICAALTPFVIAARSTSSRSSSTRGVFETIKAWIEPCLPHLNRARGGIPAYPGRLPAPPPTTQPPMLGEMSVPTTQPLMGKVSAPAPPK